MPEEEMSSNCLAVFTDWYMNYEKWKYVSVKTLHCQNFGSLSPLLGENEIIHFSNSPYCVALSSYIPTQIASKKFQNVLCSRSHLKCISFPNMKLSFQKKKKKTGVDGWIALQYLGENWLWGTEKCHNRRQTLIWKTHIFQMYPCNIVRLIGMSNHLLRLQICCGHAISRYHSV